MEQKVLSPMFFERMRECGVLEVEIDHSQGERGRVVNLVTNRYFGKEGLKYLIEYLEFMDCALPKDIEKLKNEYGL